MNNLPAIDHSLKQRLGDPAYAQASVSAFDEEDGSSLLADKELFGESIAGKRLIPAAELSGSDNEGSDEYEEPEGHTSPTQEESSPGRSEVASSVVVDVSDPTDQPLREPTPHQSPSGDTAAWARAIVAWKADPLAVGVSNMPPEAWSILVHELFQANQVLRGELASVRTRAATLAVRVTQLENRDSAERASFNRRSNTHVGVQQIANPHQSAGSAPAKILPIARPGSNPLTPTTVKPRIPKARRG